MNRKKEKDVNENVVATISQKEYKDFLLNNKCMRTHLIEFKVSIIK